MRGIWAALVLTIALNRLAPAQTTEMTEISPIPAKGTFWSLNYALPPLPYDPFPDRPLYSDGTANVYFYDDAGIDYFASRRSADASPPFPRV